MPCYTERTVTLDLKAADTDVLLRGLEAAGFSRGTLKADGEITAMRGGLRVRIAGGKIEVTGSYTTDAQAEKAVNDVKRGYASEAVRSAARRFNWQITQDAKDSNSMTLGRRY